MNPFIHTDSMHLLHDNGTVLNGSLMKARGPREGGLEPIIWVWEGRKIRKFSENPNARRECMLRLSASHLSAIWFYRKWKLRF